MNKTIAVRGNLIFKRNDGHHLYGICKNCGSDVFCWPCNFNFPLSADYVWICSGEKNQSCENSWRPEFGFQDDPEWIAK